MKRKIAAILAADLVGYSRLVAEDEEETLRRLTDYHRVFQDVITEAGGRIFKTAGDSVLAEFPSAVDALRCAINVQESLRIRNQAYPVSRQMAFRMGLTIGDVVDQDGDLLGDGVNIAARLEALAPPGGICISKAMHDAVSSKLSVGYVDMGSHQVKNIPGPIHVFSVSPDARSPASAASRFGGLKSKAGSKSEWLKPATVATALAIAVASGVLVTALTRSNTPAVKSEVAVSKSVAVQAAAPAEPAVKAEAAQSPPNVTALESAAVTPPDRGHEPVHDPIAVAVPAASVPAPTTGSSSEDTASALRLRPLRWTACRSEDTEAALKACAALAADMEIAAESRAVAQQRLGYALRKNGDLDGAVKALNTSVQIAANTAAFNDRGTALLLKGDMPSALADYSEAIRLDAKNGEAWNNRAWVNYKSGAYSKALEDADTAVSLIGDKAYAWDTRGHINEALGARKVAEADFVKALSLDPALTTSQAALKRLTGR